MLLWEALQTLLCGNNTSVVGSTVPTGGTSRRLPFDKRCAAVTKSQKRCKGKIREGSEFCCFHDPEIAERRKKHLQVKGVRRHRRLTHIPGGYLRKLTTMRAAGQSMDRLYREVRMGIITPEMGNVLFNVICRMMDSGLCSDTGVRNPARTKAHRLRPKLRDLLTRSELSAWRKAVGSAPAVYLHTDSGKQPVVQPEHRSVDAPARALTAAS